MNSSEIIGEVIRAGAKALYDRSRMGLTGSLASLRRGVKLRSNKVTNESVVHIMGDYRLRWFEKGVRGRVTRKGGRRGSLKAIRFFSNARADESGILGAMDRVFSKHSEKFGIG